MVYSPPGLPLFENSFGPALSPSFRLYPPACRPYRLEAEPEPGAMTPEQPLPMERNKETVKLKLFYLTPPQSVVKQF